MYRVLLIDDDSKSAQFLIARLLSKNLRVEWFQNPSEATGEMRRHASQYALAILNVSDASKPWLRSLRYLQEASNSAGGDTAPLYLCVSKVRKEAAFELQLERMGARLVYER